MFRIIVGLIILTTIVSGCDTLINDTSQEDEVREVLRMQQDAWNSGDLQAFMEGYVKSDRLRFAGSSGEIRGWQTTLERYQRAYPDRAAMGTLSFDLREVRLLSKKHALIFGAYTLIRENDQPTGLFTLIAEDTADGWRIVHDHTSADSTP